MYKEAGQLALRKERQLFAYRFYKQQEPLDLPTERLNEVCTGTLVCPCSHPPDKPVAPCPSTISALHRSPTSSWACPHRRPRTASRRPRSSSRCTPGAMPACRPRQMPPSMRAD